MAISQNTFAVALCILVARVQGQETVKTFADLGGKPYDVRDVETWGAGFSWLRVSRPILPLHLYVSRGGRGVRSVSSRKRGSWWRICEFWFFTRRAYEPSTLKTHVLCRSATTDVQCWSAGNPCCCFRALCTTVSRRRL